MNRGKPMPSFILQANLNHARRAQDLFLHTMVERGCGLGVVAEPYAVPPGHSSWFAGGGPGRAAPRVAIVRGSDGESPPCRMGASGSCFAAVG